MGLISTLTIKLQAQIAEFQADFKEAAKSTEKFQQEFEGVATKASAYGNLIARGVELGIEALKNLGKSILENASNISDLSAKTGLAMSTIQRFQSVAEQTGTTVDAFADAAFKLGANLAGGNKSIVNAVEDLGLAFSDLRAQSPDQQFDAITDALGRMEDPQERNRIGLILFGRTFKEIAPAVAEGYKNMADQANVSSDEQIRALDKAGDAWARFQRQALNNATSFAGGIILHFEEVEAALNKLSPRFGFFMTLSPGGLPAFADALARVRQEANDIDLSKVIADMQRLALLRLKPSEGPTLLQFGSADMKAVEADLDAGLKAFNKSLDEGTKKVDEYREALKRLKDAQIPLTVAQQDFTDEQLKLKASIGDIAKVLKISETAVSNYAKAQESLAKESLKAVSDAIKDVQQRIEDIGEAYERDLVQVLKAVADDIAGVEQKIIDSGDDFERELTETMKFIVSEIEGVEDRINSIEIKPEWFGTEFGQQLGNVIGNAFRGGSVRSAVEDGASLVGSTLLDKLATKLTTGANAITGWLGGMISSALPIIGSLLGPLVGKIADAFNGIFGNRGRDLVKDFAASFGGFDSLHTRLLDMGSAGEALWIKLTQGVGRNNPAQAAAVIAEVTAALDAFGTEAERAANRMDGIGTAIEGVNAKAALFAAPFANLLQNTDIDGFSAKLAEMGQRGQAEFERLGTFVAETFAALVLETGDVFSAIERMGPAFSVLQKGVSEFGLTSTGTINALLETFNLINDKVFGPILSNIQATGQIFIGLQDGGRMTASLFQTVATDIGASFRELEAKGGDVAKAMALSQPVLQKLWEAQQIYGDITDDTTKAILKQAAEQGIVGAHMKDVNQKILDVLIAIADVFGAKLPEAFRATGTAAKDTAASIQRDFSGIRIPPLKVPIEYEDPGFTPRGIPALAGGGIVRRRTLALVGEAGPEAVIPLNQLGAFSPASGGGGTVIWEVDGRVLAEAIVPHYPGVIRQHVRPR